MVGADQPTRQDGGAQRVGVGRCRDRHERVEHREHARCGVGEIIALGLLAHGRQVDDVDMVADDAQPEAPAWLGAGGVGAGELAGDARLVEAEQAANMEDQGFHGEAGIGEGERDAARIRQSDDGSLGRAGLARDILQTVPEPARGDVRRDALVGHRLGHADRLDDHLVAPELADQHRQQKQERGQEQRVEQDGPEPGRPAFQRRQGDVVSQPRQHRQLDDLALDDLLPSGARRPVILLHPAEPQEETPSS